MKKDKLNSKFREQARKLSPKTGEQTLISKVYESFNKLLGVNNCIQIGSYPRFTSITPVHDLDILYILGSWDEANHNPANALQSLYNQIERDYENPTDYNIVADLQTHSVTVTYSHNGEEILSVDIVPAFKYSKNEFQQDTYKVPEVLKRKHGEGRNAFYKKLSETHKQMDWIISDPRGYIKVATDTDQTSKGDFRKTVKILKAWKMSLAEHNENLKLKSFHIEQIITKYFQENIGLEIFDAIFGFFIDLPNIIENPNKIADRANNGKFIDDYLAKLTINQKQRIIEARDHFLMQLEGITDTNQFSTLLHVDFYARKSEEKFLFDFGIPVCIDDTLSFEIDGYLRNKDGFREYAYKISTNGGRVGKNNSIRFRIEANSTSANQYKWKVKNDNSCSQPRGEITDGKTRNDPESTACYGNHHVECFAIIDNLCIARAKQDVIIS